MLTQQDPIKTVLIPPGLVPWSFPPEHPAPSPSHCDSLIPHVPNNHTPPQPSNPHTCRLYEAFFPDHITLFKYFNATIQTGASVHNEAALFLERLYCAAQVNTNVVLHLVHTIQETER